MKLNQKKCSFGVEEGKFLGYMVTSKGIRANPKKMKAIADMQSFKDSKRNEKLKRKTEDAERAFQEMKKLIIELPTLTTLTPKETLFVYLDTSKDVVSEVLMADRKEKKTLFWLRWYFEAHPIKVIIDQNIKQILNKPKVFGKLAKYVVELRAHNITYVPRNAIKTRVFEDFINEISAETKHLEIYSLTGEGSLEEWTLYTKGASSLNTTNKAEYQALLAGLRIAHKMKVQALKVNVDSKLVACQLNDEFEESNEGMKADVLSKLASVAFNYLTKNVLVEFPNAKSMDAQEINAIVVEEEDNWMTPIIKCLEEGVWLRRERS
nr:hypothetical protein [Tanacetum cinerariifolium]